MRTRTPSDPSPRASTVSTRRGVFGARRTAARYVSATSISPCRSRPPACYAAKLPQRSKDGVDVGRVHLPFITEVRDHGLHEGFDESLGSGAVGQVFGKDGKRELPRFIALVAPFESIRSVAMEVEPLIKRMAVNRDSDSVDGAISTKSLHAHVLPHLA